MAAASSTRSNFWVVETTPKTNISNISDVSRSHFFGSANFNSSFARLFTKIALLRASPVSDWMLQDCFDDCFGQIHVRNSANVSAKNGPVRCCSVQFLSVFFWWVIGYAPNSSSPAHFPLVSLKEMRQLKEVNFRWADDQQFGAPKRKAFNPPEIGGMTCTSGGFPKLFDSG